MKPRSGQPRAAATAMRARARKASVMNRKSKRIASNKQTATAATLASSSSCRATRKQKAIDGRRIAYRDAGAWVSMVLGFEVRDEAHDKLMVLFEGKALQ